ncbi:predicted protein [Histoplasma capsulatum var. duboisii H88]|uniref:Predicted protein n=1 Tax=Ajellomyces capsulatus (strain H88) TaxID=544711 RepID=F0U7G4_AJEC8|nr:predicted protein [Histoplasma capsulatum var. duboisii H88]
MASDIANALCGGFQLQGEIYEVTMGRPIFEDPQLPCLKATRPNPSCTPESQEDFDTSAFNRHKADLRKPRLTIRNKLNLDSMLEEPEFQPPLSSQGGLAFGTSASCNYALNSRAL